MLMRGQYRLCRRTDKCHPAVGVAGTLSYTIFAAFALADTEDAAGEVHVGKVEITEFVAPDAGGIDISKIARSRKPKSVETSGTASAR